MASWDDIVANLEIRGRKKKVSSVATLVAFERNSHIKLPRSYRHFAATLGAGELGGFFQFCVPLARADASDLASGHAEVVNHLALKALNKRRFRRFSHAAKATTTHRLPTEPE